MSKSSNIKYLWPEYYGSGGGVFVCGCIKEKENIKITDDLIKINYIHHKYFIGLLGVGCVKAHW